MDQLISSTTVRVFYKETFSGRHTDIVGRADVEIAAVRIPVAFVKCCMTMQLRGNVLYVMI